MFFRYLKKIATVITRGPAASVQLEPDPVEFEVAGRNISNLQLLQRKNSDTLGKVGMLSWVGEMDSHRVKIYECRSVAQAKFIEQLSNDSRIKHHLPICYMRKNEFLVVEWVEGRKVTWNDLLGNRSLLDSFTKVHAAFHGEAPDYWPTEKCYFFDYLESRFNRFRNVLPLEAFTDKVYTVLKTKMPLNASRLSHPDVTPVNMIYDEETSSFKAIDNDLFTFTSYYLVDLFTTQRSMTGLSREVLIEYLQSYRGNGGDLSPLKENAEFFQALWAFRLVGTSLQEGLVQQGLNIAESYVSGFFAKHPVIEAIDTEKLA